jgi:hypothetical protein
MGDDMRQSGGDMVLEPTSAANHCQGSGGDL